MSQSSVYQEIYPQEEVLKKYIKLYYTHHSRNQTGYEKITYYPNYTVTLNVYRYSQVTWNDLSRTHRPATKQAFECLLVSKFDRSREIIMEGPFDKLTIVFHPLGINHFLPRPLSHYAQDHFSFFSAFGVPFEQLMEMVFATTESSGKRGLLDHFFRNRLNEFQEDRLQYAVQRIMESRGLISVNEIADELQCSRKTLYRLFRRHLAYAPREYRAIVKFRKALIAYQSSGKKLNFSALAYAANYYDQSDLNAQFRERTGLTPTQLFAGLQTIEQGLYWNVEGVPKVQDKR